ncbi:hypothetical protein DID80_00695 [Candidatus Marinamargulisbacteria bacterium SCGC AAA071-K20]|nr:hypothetical protein DID80_00695 [Candidatus Marinamargulisbacteria bacterium SCGC AAA071-K20]
MDGINFGTGSKRNSSSQNVKPSSSVEEAQGRNTFSKSIDSAENVAPPKSIEAPAAAEKAVETPKIETKVEPLSGKHIVDILFDLQLPPTKEFKDIITTMIKYGIPATAEGVEIVNTLTKGKKKGSLLESAVVSLSKGISDNAKSVDLLSSFFSSQLQFSEQLSELRGSILRFQSGLGKFKSLFDSGLFSGLSSIVSDLDEELKKFSKKGSNKGVEISRFSRQGFLADMKGMFGFLAGIGKKLERQHPTSQLFQQFRNELQGFRKSISGMINALATQVILSKSSKFHNLDDFAFFQVPNPLATDQSKKNINLLIRKNKKGKESKIDPGKTRMVIKFETPELGEVAVVIDVSEKKLWYTFQTKEGKTKKYIMSMQKDLIDRMETLDYNVQGIKTLLKKLDLKSLLLPTLDLDKLSRVQAEA